MPGESKGTVLLALAANVSVGAIKFTGAALTGSAALFSEGAQSVSDMSAKLDSYGIERASFEIDRGITERCPEVTDVFLDATGTGEQSARSGAHLPPEIN